MIIYGHPVECELQHQKITAEDKCRIKAADLEAALLQQRNDGQCSSDGNQIGDRPCLCFAVNLPNRLQQSGLACKFSAPFVLANSAAGCAAVRC